MVWLVYCLLFYLYQVSSPGNTSVKQKSIVSLVYIYREKSKNLNDLFADIKLVAMDSNDVLFNRKKGFMK